MITGTLIVRMVRNINAALTAEVFYWLDRGGRQPRLHREDDVLSLAWQDVNDCLYRAMEDYPLEAAARDEARI